MVVMNTVLKLLGAKAKPALWLKKFALKSFIPALFGHATEDIFVQPHHSDIIYKSYAGDKNIIKFEGDHNSPRPQFYYDSVSIFFYNVLHPPPISSSTPNKVEKYYDLGDLRVGRGADASVLYEIIADLRAAGNNAASSSSAPPGIPLSSGSTVKSVVELLSESVSGMSVKDEVNFLFDEANIDVVENASEGSHSQDKANVHNDVQNGEYSSHSSSNRESWGRCSSLGGGSEESSSAGVPGVSDSKEQADDPGVSDSKGQETSKDSGQHELIKKQHNTSKGFRALTTPLRRIQKSSTNVKDKKKGTVTPKKQKEQVKLEKGNTLSQRLRLCFLRRVPHHKRHKSV